MPGPSHTRPNQWALLLHLGKTFALIQSILRDSRISVLPKATFITAITALIVALLGGDAVSELVSNVVPIVGPALGIPVDATIDWAFFAVAAFNLLKLFPTGIVGEHYDRLFRTVPSGR